ASRDLDLAATRTLAGAPSAQLPRGSGPSPWFDRPRPAPISAHTLIAPVGLPIAPSGMAHSAPMLTPAPEPASQPAVTPARFVSSIVARTLYGLVPPLKVPGPPASADPSPYPAPPPAAGSSA